MTRRGGVSFPSFNLSVQPDTVSCHTTNLEWTIRPWHCTLVSIIHSSMYFTSTICSPFFSLNLSLQPDTVSCRTTNFDRTIKTLGGVLSGLYPDNKTPIPVVTSSDLDEILYAGKCGGYGAKEEEVWRG